MTPDIFASKSYDFVVVGGGTAGLTLAARLSEDANTTVGVIEGGANRLNDPMVDTPAMFLHMFGDPKYDWAFQTTPQKHTGNRVHGWPRGECLGGSSAINYQMFSHPSKQDLDNWAELGNKGWNWDELVPYFRKFEKYNPLSEKVGHVFNHEYIDPLLRGTNGPIQISFSENDANFLQEVWPGTCKRAGYPEPRDPRSGSALGGFNQLTTVDPKTVTRSYSASAYYAPNAERSDLFVLTDAVVSKIVFDRDRPTSPTLTATGVEFTVDGQTYSIKASKEVLLCAGAIQSPQVLELSGIGARSVLEKHNIEVMIENPGVGENLQDHAAVPMCWETAEGILTVESLRDPDILEYVMNAYTTTKAGPLGNTVTCTSFIPYQTVASSATTSDVSQHVDQVCDAAPKLPASQALIQHRQLLDPGEAALQIVALPTGADITRSHNGSGTFLHEIPGNYCTLAACLTHPFSRGSVHIQSANVSDYPAIDPAYLSHPLDVDILAHTILHLNDIATTEPLASKLKDHGTVPMPKMKISKTLDEAKEHVRNNCVTEYHPIGTCSMLPREDGGVVGADLKVYGTANVRVVDASIFPLHVQGNIQSVVYAVAEKAADMIKASLKDGAAAVNGANGVSVTNGAKGH